MLGSTAVTLVRTSATEVGLMIPAVTAGTYALNATLDGFTYSAVSLAVTVTATPADPVTYVNGILQGWVTGVQSYQTKWANQSDVAPAFNAALADVQAAQTQFAGFDAATQATIATMLAANNLPQFEDFFSGWSIRTVADFARVAAAVTLVSVVAGPELVVAAAIYAVATSNLLDDFATGVNAAFRPADQPAVSDEGLVTLNFTNNVAQAVPLEVAMQNLSQDDVNSTNPKIQAVVSDFNDDFAMWPQIDPSLTTPLGTPPSLATVAPVVTNPPADGTLFTITNISSSDVTLSSYVGAMGNGTMTFTSPTCPSGPEIDFTFDLVYDDPNFPAITTTVQATLTCAAPCDASTCTGCCDASGVCQPGDIVTACGTAGRACTTTCSEIGPACSQACPVSRCVTTCGCSVCPP